MEAFDVGGALPQICLFCNFSDFYWSYVMGMMFQYGFSPAFSSSALLCFYFCGVLFSESTFPVDSLCPSHSRMTVYNLLSLKTTRNLALMNRSRVNGQVVKCCTAALGTMRCDCNLSQLLHSCTNKKASIRWQDSARRQFQAGIRGDLGL